MIVYPKQRKRLSAVSDTSYPTIIDRINLQIAVNERQIITEKKRSPELYILAGQTMALRWVLRLYDTSPTTKIEE